MTRTGPREIWSKPLSNGALAVGLFNRADFPSPITLKLQDVGFDKNAKLRDLWKGSEVTAKNGTYTVTVPAYGAVLLKVRR